MLTVLLLPTFIDICTGVFDVFIDRKGRVRLLGMAPFGNAGSKGCDPCLFSWEELFLLAQATNTSDPLAPLVCEHGVHVGGVAHQTLHCEGGSASSCAVSSAVPSNRMPDVRVVESDALRFSRDAVHAFPEDLLHIAAGGATSAEVLRQVASTATHPDSSDDSSCGGSDVE